EKSQACCIRCKKLSEKNSCQWVRLAPEFSPMLYYSLRLLIQRLWSAVVRETGRAADSAASSACLGAFALPRFTRLLLPSHSLTSWISEGPAASHISAALTSFTPYETFQQLQKWRQKRRRPPS